VKEIHAGRPLKVESMKKQLAWDTLAAISRWASLLVPPLKPIICRNCSMPAFGKESAHRHICCV